MRIEVRRFTVLLLLIVTGSHNLISMLQLHSWHAYEGVRKLLNRVVVLDYLVAVIN